MKNCYTSKKLSASINYIKSTIKILYIQNYYKILYIIKKIAGFAPYSLIRCSCRKFLRGAVTNWWRQVPSMMIRILARNLSRGQGELLFDTLTDTQISWLMATDKTRRLPSHPDRFVMIYYVRHRWMFMYNLYKPNTVTQTLVFFDFFFTARRRGPKLVSSCSAALKGPPNTSWNASASRERNLAHFRSPRECPSNEYQTRQIVPLSVQSNGQSTISDPFILVRHLRCETRRFNRACATLSLLCVHTHI